MIKNSVNNVIITNKIEEEKKYEYLHPKGNIYCLRDPDYNFFILSIELEVEGWVPSIACVWSDKKMPHKWLIYCTSMPITSPILSCLRYSKSNSPFPSCSQ